MLGFKWQQLQLCLSVVKVKPVTDPIYSVFTVHNGSALQHVYVVSPGKLGAVSDIVLQKDVDRKVARLIVTVENTAYEESLKDLTRCMQKNYLIQCTSIHLYLTVCEQL